MKVVRIFIDGDVYYDEVINVVSSEIVDGILMLTKKDGSVLGFKHYESFLIEEMES